MPIDAGSACVLKQTNPADYFWRVRVGQIIEQSSAIIRPFPLDGPLSFQHPLLLQHALPLLVLLRQVFAGALDVALYLNAPVLTPAFPRGL
ncbi:hypothetical protein [Loktanella sp. M215]|uniref:hypothetical protein n=1 Tax=Loktanella sp. M215 TaxID=2675431 RepID=UPI001F1B888E|nr:hypothetical protein [Loktanella sp. M215]MCF7701775.1 hypothetical protein [Loktanella sp. M215]